MNSCGKEQEERIVYSKYFQDVIESKCHYLKGTNIKQGKCVEFNRQGDTIGVFQYVNNKLNGRQIYFHKNNGVRKIVNYRNDFALSLIGNAILYGEKNEGFEELYNIGMKIFKDLGDTLPMDPPVKSLLDKIHEIKQRIEAPIRNVMPTN